MGTVKLSGETAGGFTLLFNYFGHRSRIMRWDGHVASVGRVRMLNGFWWGNMKEIDSLEEPEVCGRIILKLIQGKGWSIGLD